MQFFFKAKAGSEARTQLYCGDNDEAQDRKVFEAAQHVGASILTRSPDGHTLLLEISPEQRKTIETESGVELFPNYLYSLTVLHEDIEMLSATVTPPSALGNNKFNFCVVGTDGEKIADAKVTVKLPTGERAGATSNSDGEVSFLLSQSNVTDITVNPRANYWCASTASAKSGDEVRKLLVEKLDLPFADSLGHFYPSRAKISGKGIKVAVIDSGVDAHKDLPGITVKRTILGGIQKDGCTDNGLDHGTHVAGIIAGSQFGVAPMAELFAYAVFPEGSDKAGSIDIATAIDLAVQDGADIINLSLGVNKHDKAIEASVKNAVDEGVFVVAATGNDGKSEVLFPARLDDVFSVGAIGVEKAFATTSTHRFHTEREKNKNNEFVPTFSNFSQGKVNGAAPGVAVISTVLVDGYQAKSGTSMSTPVVAGVAARLLSENPDVAKLTGRNRVEKLRQLLYTVSQKRDLDEKYVGAGIPTQLKEPSDESISTVLRR